MPIASKLNLISNNALSADTKNEFDSSASFAAEMDTTGFLRMFLKKIFFVINQQNNQSDVLNTPQKIVL